MLVAGLGNPGSQYQANRHNIGFHVVDRLAEDWRAPDFREKFEGLFSKASVGQHSVVLLKPQTYMNLSGQSVQKTLHFFKLSLADLLVVHDELDLPFGSVRLKRGGGTAGHNGLRSIGERCGGPNYLRLRLGVGRPPAGRRSDSYVLSDFTAEEQPQVQELLEEATKAVELIVRRGADEAMNRINRRN